MPTALPDLLPFLREGSISAVGEALLSLTVASEDGVRSVPRSGAKPWSDAEVGAFLRALDQGGRGPGHGHSMPFGELILDTVRIAADPGSLYFLVWQGEHLVRAIGTEDQKHAAWEPVSAELLGPWLAARRADPVEVARDRRRALNPLRVAAAGTRGVVGLTTEAINAVGHLRHEPYWQAETTVVAMVVLSLSLHKRFQVGPNWLMPALEGLLLLSLFLHDPRHLERATRLPQERLLPRVMLGVVTLANTISLFFLVHELLSGSNAGGHALILSAVVIWLTNVGIFALAFWELDRGGPDDRVRTATAKPASFLFPQMTLGEAERWMPSFMDYLYTSFTNATAFSPTDTMPLGPWPKMLMLVQSLASLVTVGLVAARAVNILK